MYGTPIHASGEPTSAKRAQGIGRGRPGHNLQTFMMEPERLLRLKGILPNRAQPITLSNQRAGL
jgi:hypothetical protein